MLPALKHGATALRRTHALKWIDATTHHAFLPWPDVASVNATYERHARCSLAGKPGTCRVPLYFPSPQFPVDNLCSARKRYFGMKPVLLLIYDTTLQERDGSELGAADDRYPKPSVFTVFILTLMMASASGIGAVRLRVQGLGSPCDLRS